MPHPNILEFMETGSPVAVRFIQEPDAPATDKLFCELVLFARQEGSVTFSTQGCPIGAYVLNREENPPGDYYLKSGRYRNRTSAAEAARSLPKLRRQYGAVRLFPLQKIPDDFHVALFFLTPLKAMQVIQALSYHTGLPIEFRTGGTTSLCGDCTAAVDNTRQLCISFGCKGSRKHAGYGDDEVIIGIPEHLIIPIQEGLLAIPGVFD